MDSFPESHAERVQWALARRAEFTFKNSSFNIDTDIEHTPAELYLALAAVGLLDEEYSEKGTSRERLFLATLARQAGVPVVPHNVYEGLQFCCQRNVILLSVDEMVRQGHFPRAKDYAWLCETARGLCITPDMPERSQRWLAIVHMQDFCNTQSATMTDCPYDQLQKLPPMNPWARQPESTTDVVWINQAPAECELSMKDIVAVKEELSVTSLVDVKQETQ